MLMKRNGLLAIIATCIMMFAVCLPASAKDKKNVERGMSKEEVVAILGEPKLTSFDAYGDKWEYIKTSNFITGEAKYITVLFDRSGKVVQYDTKITEANNSKDCHQRPVLPYGDGSFPDAPANFVCCIDDASFSKLYNKVENATFKDNKFEILEIASIGCFYSCAQTAYMMRIFSFGDEQLKALRMMAPRIVDPQNAAVIYNVLTFDSEKEEAAEIIRRCRY